MNYKFASFKISHLKHRFKIICLLVLFCAASAWSAVLEFFYDGDCSVCRAVKNETIAEALAAFPETVFLEYDLTSDAGLEKFLTYRQELGFTETDAVAVVLNGRVYLGGRQDLETNLLRHLADLDQSVVPPMANLDNWFETQSILSISAVVLAGLADGINPCAFATIVFLVSFLLTREKRLASYGLYGFCFCAGVFLAYFLLGFGILRLLIRCDAWQFAGSLLRRVAAGFLLLSALASFRDAWRFKLSGDPQAMSLKLPAWLQRYAREIVKWGAEVSLKAGIGMFLAGVLVTLLEAPCSGQIYASVLFYLSRQEFSPVAWFLLLVYNFFFLLPHVLVFILAAYWQTPGGQLAGWARRNVVSSKVLLGLVMLCMAVLLSCLV